MQRTSAEVARRAGARLPAAVVLTLAGSLGASACAQMHEPDGAGGASEIPVVEAANAALSTLPVPAFCGVPSELSSYALYANSWVALGAGSHVTGGAVGVHKPGAPLPAGMSAQLTLGPNVVVSSSEILSAPSVEVAAGATVGAVLSNSVSGAGDHDSVSPFPSDMPALPDATDAAVGANRLRVPQNALVYIDAPTSWSEVEVEAGGTLYLMAEGTYGMTRLTVGVGAHLYTNKSVELHVQQGITVASDGRIMPNPAVEHLTAKDLNVRSTPAPGAGASNPSFEIGQGAAVRLLFIAPSASLLLGADAQLTGAVAVDNLKSGENARIIYEDGLKGSGCRDLCASEQITKSGFLLVGSISFVPQDVEEGDFLVKYEDGCMKYNWAQTWTVNARVGTYSWYLVGATPQDVLTALPGTEGYTGGVGSDGGGFATFEECVAANKQLPPIAVHHPGGPMGIYLKDVPYSDNVSGLPNPTWSITRVSAHGTCGVAAD